MRLWLQDSERRPDPAPFATDERIPVLVGWLLWVLAGGAVLVVLPDAREVAWPVVAAGVVLGLVLAAYVLVRRARR